jgi:hypothetical protein
MVQTEPSIIIQQTSSITQWISIIGVVIGSIIAYYALNTTEREKRNFELKKEAYLDFLKLLKEGSLVFAARKVTDKRDFYDEHGNEDKAKKEALRDQVLWMNKFSKSSVMIKLCGSKKVNDLIEQNNPSETLSEFYGNIDIIEKYFGFERDLIDAMREDLLESSSIIHKIRFKLKKQIEKLKDFKWLN